MRRGKRAESPAAASDSRRAGVSAGPAGDDRPIPPGPILPPVPNERRDADDAAPAAGAGAAAEEDQTLAQRAKHHREAFGALYERYVGAIYRYVYYRVGNVEDAEDLTARVFMNALRHMRNYSDRGIPFSAWLYRIAHNVVANYHRDNNRHPSVPLDEMERHGAHHDDADAKIDIERRRDQLIRAIALLPEDRQQVVVLKFVQQLQNAEIGQIMNRSEGAIKSLYHRTLLQLREALDAVA